MVPGVGEVAGPIQSPEVTQGWTAGLGNPFLASPPPPPLLPPFVPELLPFQFLPWRQPLDELRVQCKWTWVAAWGPLSSRERSETEVNRGNTGFQI